MSHSSGWGLRAGSIKHPSKHHWEKLAWLRWGLIIIVSSLLPEGIYFTVLSHKLRIWMQQKVFG